MRPHHKLQAGMGFRDILLEPPDERAGTGAVREMYRLGSAVEQEIHFLQIELGVTYRAPPQVVMPTSSTAP